jgi:hypothetical protein
MYCVTVAFKMTERADKRICIIAPVHFTALLQAFFGGQNIASPRSVITPTAQVWLLDFPKAKIALEREEICECDGHTVHKLKQWRITAD